MGIEQTSDGGILSEGEVKAKAAQRMVDAAVRVHGEADLPVVFSMLFDDGPVQEEFDLTDWKGDIQTSLEVVRGQGR